MFNTTKTFPYATHNLHTSGLTYSNKILSLQDIDKKIKSTRNHIAHLTSQLRCRKTHGGKAYRARKITLQDQIFISSQRIKRLELLKIAKMSPPKVEKEERSVGSINRNFSEPTSKEIHKEINKQINHLLIGPNYFDNARLLVQPGSCMLS